VKDENVCARVYVLSSLSLTLYRPPHTLNLIRFSFKYFFLFTVLAFGAAHTVPALISFPFLIIMVAMEVMTKREEKLFNRIFFFMMIFSTNLIFYDFSKNFC
jgi:hypothetical protein